MSASLVGSEMCIRDRARDRPPDFQKSASGAGAGGVFWGSPWRGSARSCSVSYTHLTLPTICSV
eukprot:12451642-Alexandrium_andersonii.AAC.1